MKVLKTIAELRAATDEEVIEFVREVLKIENPSQYFKEKFSAEYSYTTLKAEPEKRGYHLDYVKDNDDTNTHKTVTVYMGKPFERLNLSMDKDVKERYKAFIDKYGSSRIHTTIALSEYMDAVENGELTPIIEVFPLSQTTPEPKGKGKKANKASSEE